MKKKMAVIFTHIFLNTILSSDVSAVTLENGTVIELCSNCNPASVNYLDGQAYVTAMNFNTNRIEAIPFDGGAPIALYSFSEGDDIFLGGGSGEFVTIALFSASTWQSYRYSLFSPTVPLALPNHAGLFPMSALVVNSTGESVGFVQSLAATHDNLNGTRVYSSLSGGLATGFDILAGGNVFVGESDSIATVWTNGIGQYLSGGLGRATVVASTVHHDQTILGQVNNIGGYWYGPDVDFVPLFGGHSGIAAMESGILIFSPYFEDITPDGCLALTSSGAVNVGSLLTPDMSSTPCIAAVQLPGTMEAYVLFRTDQGTTAMLAKFDIVDGVADLDNDGIEDALDNCIEITNVDQVDTDSDGYGNACDGDFNNDCIVNFIDIAAFSNEFLGANLLFDFNNDGVVNFLDFTSLANSFLTAPGPGLDTGACQ